MSLSAFLVSIGIGTASNLISEAILNYIKSTPQPTTDGLRNAITPLLNIQDARIKADNIIEFLAQRGDITIQGTRIYASNGVRMGSAQNTTLVFGNNSSSKTRNSSIDAGFGAYIVAQGGASVQQHEDGSISFCT